MRVRDIHHVRYISPCKSSKMSHLKPSLKVVDREDTVVAAFSPMADTIEHNYSLNKSEVKHGELFTLRSRTHKSSVLN